MTSSTEPGCGKPGKQAEFVMAALNKYERLLTRYATRLLSGDLSAARDVVQHVFLKLCEKDCRTIEDRLAPWLYTVCRNRSIDLIRGRNNEEQLDQTDIPANRDRNGTSQLVNPARIVEEADFFDKLRSLIDELPETQREIVELWSHGFTSQEIGQITGIKPGTVRTSMHRAVKQLKSHETVRRWLGELKEEKDVVSPPSDRFRKAH